MAQKAAAQVLVEQEAAAQVLAGQELAAELAEKAYRLLVEQQASAELAERSFRLVARSVAHRWARWAGRPLAAYPPGDWPWANAKARETDRECLPHLRR